MASILGGIIGIISHHVPELTLISEKKKKKKDCMHAVNMEATEFYAFTLKKWIADLQWPS